MSVQPSKVVKPPPKRAGSANNAAKEDQRPSPRMSEIHDFDNFVTVLVGESEQRFTLHQDAVCPKSKFFKKACSTTWREGQEGIVRLPEVTAVTFQAYSTWLYTGQIAVGPCTEASAFDEKMGEFQLLIDLYLLGDKLLDIQLRNQANIALFKSMQKVNSVPDVRLTTLVWESTVSGSLLRKLLVDVIVWRFDRDSYAGSISRYPAEHVQEVAVAVLRATSILSWEQMAQKLSPYEEAEETS